MGTQKKFFFFGFFFMVMKALAAAALAVAGVNAGCSGTDFDYYLLVQHWPAALGHAATKYFTLHGMWPSRIKDADTYPCQCTNKEFSQSEISDLATDMNQYWSSLKGHGGNVEFWDHEWTKHGTCSPQIDQGTNVHSYFNTTLGLRAQVDTYGALAAAGILPGKSYSAMSVQGAIKKAVGVTPTLGCVGKDLAVVGLCFDKETVKLQDCSDSIVHNTHDSVSNCDLEENITFSNGGSGPSPPTPAGDKCVPNKHGPVCNSDADCKDVPGCVRCASSGYCTDVPRTLFGGKVRVW